MDVKIGGLPVGWLMGKKQPKVGDSMPDFVVKNADGQPIANKDLLGKRVLISVVPNLKTKVCSLETRHFNEVAGKFKGIKFITISNNSPAQQKNWCAASGVNNIEILSDVDGSFGKAMGLYIPIFKHLARVVYLVNPKGIIEYEQVVPEITKQPNYEPIISQLEKLIKK